MKPYQITAVTLLALVLGTHGSAQETKTAAPPAVAPPPAGLESLEKRVSYSIGLGFGKNLQEQEIQCDVDLLMEGIRDGLTGADPKLTEPQIEACMAEFRAVFVAQQQEKAKAAADKNLKEGQAFLQANKAKPDVKTTASGLQYQILQDGQGNPPKATDTVKVHYQGKLLDGTEFDSSYKRNEPATFPLNQVIKGWTEGLQYAKPGSKLRLFIPSELAYGENGPPGSGIGPNSVLVFDIELLEVLK